MVEWDKLAAVLARQAAATTTAALASATSSPPGDGSPGNCPVNNDYDGNLGGRVSAIFVILATSVLGTLFPILAHRHKQLHVPDWVFFIAKYFGSGVIVATAFIHLLAPAQAALGNPCLVGPITQYSWPEGIALMTIFVLFFTEFMAMRYAVFGHQEEHEHGHAHSHNHAIASSKSADKPISPYSDHDLGNASPSRNPEQEVIRQSSNAHQPGDDHLGHAREHTHHEDVEAANNQPHSHSGSAGVEDYAAQMTAIFILEFGVIFHSIFIGLTLAVSGPEFSTLYVVIVFHQTFEGLGLGARLAVTPWPKNNKMTPYILALIYAVSTPIAISIGLGVRQTYVPGSQTALVANGVFDSISAGILIYTGLVELMAHEFMFSTTMRKAPIKVPLAAFGVMCLGAGLMALLGKWA